MGCKGSQVQILPSRPLSGRSNLLPVPLGTSRNSAGRSLSRGVAQSGGGSLPDDGMGWKDQILPSRPLSGRSNLLPVPLGTSRNSAGRSLSRGVALSGSGSLPDDGMGWKDLILPSRPLSGRSNLLPVPLGTSRNSAGRSLSRGVALSGSGSLPDDGMGWKDQILLCRAASRETVLVG